MSITTIYHHPRCSKSRQALQLLRDHHIDPLIIEYLKHPPSVTDLRTLLHLLPCSLQEMVRHNEAEYREHHLADADEETLLQTLHNIPSLIQRPIIVHRERAIIARPPELILDIL